MLNICVSRYSKTFFEYSRTLINANAFITANPQDLTRREPVYSKTVLPFLNSDAHIFNLHNEECSRTLINASAFIKANPLDLTRIEPVYSKYLNSNPHNYSPKSILLFCSHTFIINNNICVNIFILLPL